MIISSNVCSFFDKEMREEWHRQRGIEDPLLKVVRKKPMEDPVPKIEKPRFVAVNQDVEKVIKEGGSTREEKERARLAEYRAKNKEKLAAKARERRARQ